MRIHVFGEALVDLIPTAPGPLSPLQPALGGGPFNVAVAAAQLGGNVAFHSIVSTDGFGRAIMSRLAAAGVDTSPVQRTAAPTPLAVASIGDDGSASYGFHCSTQGLASPLLPHRGHGVAVFGTLSLWVQPAADLYCRVLRDAFAAGWLVMLDPNLRDVTTTPEHLERLRGLLPFVHVLKCNDSEFPHFAGAPCPVSVVTRGADGIDVHLPGQSPIHADAPDVDVVDTIGAGDTALAAIAVRLAQSSADPAQAVADADWQAIADSAAAQAAATCTHPGAGVAG